MLYFSNFLTLDEKEKELVSKYLNFEVFDKILKLTGVLNEKNFDKIGLNELNDILQKKWCKRTSGEKSKERWEIEPEFFKNEAEIKEEVLKVFKKDFLVNFEIDKNKNIKLLEKDYFKDIDTVIVFGSTFLSVLQRTLCAKAIIENNSDKKIELIFLTGFRKLDERVDFNDEKRSKILENIFNKSKEEKEDFFNFKSETEEDFIKKIAEIISKKLLNCKINVLSSDKEINGVRATTASTLQDFFEKEKKEDLFNKKIIGISAFAEFINFQQSVVDLISPKKEIKVYGFDENIIDKILDNILIEGRIRSLTENLDTISRIIYNCSKIYQLKI